LTDSLGVLFALRQRRTRGFAQLARNAQDSTHGLRAGDRGYDTVGDAVLGLKDVFPARGRRLRILLAKI
jgi:hypothetical protein